VYKVAVYNRIPRISFIKKDGGGNGRKVGASGTFGVGITHAQGRRRKRELGRRMAEGRVPREITIRFRSRGVWKFSSPPEGTRGEDGTGREEGRRSGGGGAEGWLAVVQLGKVAREGGWIAEGTGRRRR